MLGVCFYAPEFIFTEKGGWENEASKWATLVDDLLAYMVVKFIDVGFVPIGEGEIGKNKRGMLMFFP
jgi:hypothetical protein